MKSEQTAMYLIIGSIIFGLWGFITLMGEPAQLLGGDAYNYMTAAGRGTGLVCIGIIFAILANTLNPKD